MLKLSRAKLAVLVLQLLLCTGMGALGGYIGRTYPATAGTIGIVVLGICLAWHCYYQLYIRPNKESQYCSVCGCSACECGTHYNKLFGSNSDAFEGFELASEQDIISYDAAVRYVKSYAAITATRLSDGHVVLLAANVWHSRADILRRCP